jgi:hypothetical protein
MPVHFCGLCLYNLFLPFLLPRDGDDCEFRGGLHEWFNHDNENSKCFHCGIVRPGKLWPGGQTPEDWARTLGITHLLPVEQYWLSSFREIKRGDSMWKLLSDDMLKEFRARILDL